MKDSEPKFLEKKPYKRLRNDLVECGILVISASMIAVLISTIITYLSLILLTVSIGSVFAILLSISMAVTTSDKFMNFLYVAFFSVRNSEIEESKIISPSRYKLLKMSGFLFSKKTQKETFETAMADWDFEIFESIKEYKDSNLFMINARYTYAFLAAMWQKSPIGDLIEFVSKLAK